VEPNDPISEAESVIREHEADFLAEQAKNHAEMVLFAAVNGKNMIQAQLLHEASKLGMEYLTGILVAVGLTARNWTRRITGDPHMEPGKYINPEAEIFCEIPGDGFAHYLTAEILRVEEVPHADLIRREMADFAAKRSIEDWGHVVAHVIYLFTELLNAVLDVCNGDYVPGAGDDR
jgi:hypothetical protein